MSSAGSSRVVHVHLDAETWKALGDRQKGIEKRDGVRVPVSVIIKSLLQKALKKSAK